jgi:hypothetical protein
MKLPLACVVALAFQEAPPPAPPLPVRFEVSVASSLRDEPLTGRLLVIVSKSAQPEPRRAISPSGPALFAVDLEALEPGETALVDEKSVGYPWPLRELPPGDYHVQALVNVYEEVRRSVGPPVWLHVNDGRQEPMGLAVGNLHGDVQRVHVGVGGEGGEGATVALEITHAIAPRPPPVDTAWVKHVSIGSAKLAQFWGRPTSIHATLLLPRGYAEHPDARYPVVYTFGHDVPFSFSTERPADASPDGAPVAIDPVRGVESGFDFQRAWTADGFPRLIAISFEQQTPFFPDSYSVDSENCGPYGAAMVEEVIPELERRFRIVAEPWARHVEGASTGGWQALALQLFHPDFFGGAWVLQPDPIDFRSYQLVDLYRDRNAFELPLGPFGAVERPFRRTVEGQPVWSVRQMSLFEEALGSRGRSGFQLEGWEAVFGPRGEDGYPRPLWDKRTGAIDRSIADSMRERGFDLRDHAQRDWKTLGPRLAGKLHFFAGDMDDFYLNLAVYRFEEFLRGATDPVSDAEFTYGRPKKGHGWHAFPWAEFVRRVAAAMRAHAPPASDGAWPGD